MDFTWSFKYFSFKYKFYFLMKKPEFKNSDLAKQIEKTFPDAKLIDIEEDNND